MKNITYTGYGIDLGKLKKVFTDEDRHLLETAEKSDYIQDLFSDDIVLQMAQNTGSFEILLYFEIPSVCNKAGKTSQYSVSEANKKLTQAILYLFDLVSKEEHLACLSLTIDKLMKYVNKFAEYDNGNWYNFY